MIRLIAHWGINMVLYVLLALPCAAQKGIPASVLGKVDSIYQGFAEKSHAPGMVYGILYQGELVHVGYSGQGNLEQGQAVNEKTVFRIASMTKSFIGAAIVKLRDEGKLGLGDAVHQYIPEMNAQALLTKDAPDLTIRHLLTHAAGFPEDNPWGDRQLDIGDEELLALIKKGFSFSNSPGVTYEYSNTAFALLGYIIKQVTGQSYNDYVDNEILKPLGMNNTYWEYEKVPENQLALGYRWVNGEWVKQPMLHDGAYGAMGGLMTSMEDFAKYALFHLEAWPARDDGDKGPVKRSSLREMQHPWNFNNLNTANTYDGVACPITSAYGYGLRWTHDCLGRTMVGHTGGLPGFGSNWLVLPAYGLGVICFGNVTYFSAVSVNMQAVDALIQHAGLDPAKVPASSILAQRKQELLAFLPNWKEQGREEVFADNFFLDNYDDLLREESRFFFDAIGKVEGTSDIIAQNNLRGTFTILGEKGKLSVFFTLSPESEPKIQQVRIRMEQ